MSFLKPVVMQFNSDLLGLPGLKPVWGCVHDRRGIFFVVLIPEELAGFELFDAIVLAGPIGDMRIYGVREGHIYEDGGGFVEIKEGPFKGSSLGFKKDKRDGTWKAYHDGVELPAFEIQVI